MQKRGQLLSFDLVLGVLIFIAAFIFMLKQVDKIIINQNIRLNLQSDIVFNSLEINLKNPKYSESTGNKAFIDNFKIYARTDYGLHKLNGWHTIHRTNDPIITIGCWTRAEPSKYFYKTKDITKSEDADTSKSKDVDILKPKDVDISQYLEMRDYASSQ